MKKDKISFLMMMKNEKNIASLSGKQGFLLVEAKIMGSSRKTKRLTFPYGAKRSPATRHCE